MIWKVIIKNIAEHNVASSCTLAPVNQPTWSHLDEDDVH